MGHAAVLTHSQCPVIYLHPIRPSSTTWAEGSTQQEEEEVPPTATTIHQPSLKRKATQLLELR